MSGETIAERVAEVRARIAAACARSGRSADDVTLIAVTKGFGVDAIREAIAADVTNIGENRVQEAAAKRDAISGVTWHMIGHLQTNKVATALGLFDVIHSVDSIRLAEAISGRASASAAVFLEVNVADEPSKGGFSLTAIPDAVLAIGGLPNIEVRGLMTVAPIADRSEDVRPVFRQLREVAHDLGLAGLSMGMTNDYEIAIEEGATHVRVGRAIFGERP